MGVRLYLKLFPNSQKDLKKSFVNVALVGLLIFFLIYKRDGILGIFDFSLNGIFSLNSWKTEIFEFRLLPYFIRWWGQSFKLGMCVGKGQLICD